MRFFAHDGKTTHGPAAVDELLKLPGFDGDTLVCPVGSADSADWKPALAYPPFKRALLAAEVPAPAPVAAAPAPIAAPAAAPIPVLPPAPPMPTFSPMTERAPEEKAPDAACPRCEAANPAKAAYCNACGAKMDARLENLSPAAAPIASMPAAAAPIATPAPAPGSDPFAPTDPFAAFDPMNAEPPMAAGPALPSAPPPTPAPSPVSPMSGGPMSRGPQPGGMGRLSDFDAPSSLAPEPVSAPAVAPLPDDPHVLVTNPDAEPHAAPVPWFKRPPVLAGLAVALLVIGGLGYYALLAPDPLPADPVAELNPSATPMDMPPAPAAAPPAAPPTFTSTPAPPPSRASFPVIDKPARKKSPSLGSGSPAPKAKRNRRKRAPAVVVEPPSEPKVEPDFPSDGGGETMIESRAPEPKPKAARKGKRAAAAAGGERDPLLESLLADATEGGTADPIGASSAEPGPPAGIENQPAPARSGPVIGQRPAAPASADGADAPIDPPGEPKSFSLPGLRRPVSATGRAPAARAPAPPPRAPVRSADLAAILAEPGDAPADAAPADAPPSDEGAAPESGEAPAKRSADGDQVALVQVHEQFDFCAQLLAQGAFGDHYDTCLCKDAREAAPFRGRRGFYVSALQKEAKGGKLETIAKITSSSLEGGAATVVARWKSSADGKGREVSQTWRLEDGLWCRAP